MKPVVLFTAAVMLAAHLFTISPARAAEPELVDWPELTRFNPDLVDYEFTLADPDGAGHLFALWGPSRIPAVPWFRHPDPRPVPHVGTVEMSFWQSGQNRIFISRCTSAEYSDDTCTTVAESPELAVHSEFTVRGLGSVGGPMRPGPATARIQYYPVVPDLTTSWELVDPDEPGVVHAGGTLAAGDLVSRPGRRDSEFRYDVPPGLASGTYRVIVRMSADTADFGPLAGTSGPEGPLVQVDSQTPRLGVAKVPATFYPSRDGHLDEIVVQATTSEATTGVLEVTNATGARVFSSTGHEIREGDVYRGASWNGRDRAGRIVPAGRYGLRFRVADRAGNDAVWTGAVTVSHQRLQWVTFKRRVTAAASRAGRPAVGRCSTLATLPRGALGLYSQTKCKREAQSVVATVHGIYIPKAHANRYRWLQVTLNGGPATASSKNYLVMWFARPGNRKSVHRSEFRKGRTHRSTRITAPHGVIFDRTTDKPYLIWRNGLTAGSRYQVRSYTVTVRYRALR